MNLLVAQFIMPRSKTSKGNHGASSNVETSDQRSLFNYDEQSENKGANISTSQTFLLCLCKRFKEKITIKTDIKMIAFWNVAPRSLDVDRRFRSGVHL